MQKPTKTGLKRVNFDIDDQLYNRVDDIAKARKTTFSNRAREYMKLGVLADELAYRGEGEVIVRLKNGKEYRPLF